MFKPTYVFDKVGEITPDFLAKKHIKGPVSYTHLRAHET